MVASGFGAGIVAINVATAAAAVSTSVCFGMAVHPIVASSADAHGMVVRSNPAAECGYPCDMVDTSPLVGIAYDGFMGCSQH
jgi:hypothetical protein